MDLVVGGELALEVCKRQAREGDFGELHAAVRVFCRQNRQDLVLWVLEELDPEDAESIQAVSDALKHEFPEGLARRHSCGCCRKVIRRFFLFSPIFSVTVDYKAGTELVKVLRATPTDSLSRVIWALGRLREQDARAPLLTYLQHEDASVCSATALALLRLGDQQALNHCLQLALSQSWPLIPLGLGGNRSAVTVLLDRARAGQAEADCLIALGLLGDASAIATLLAYLTTPSR